MDEWLNSLTDAMGYVPLRTSGAWSQDWISLHVTSDLLLWLAFIALPIVLIAGGLHPFVRPYRRYLLLFGSLLLACGFTHLVESLLFESPVYRMLGVLKAATAVLAWLTVFALIPVVPRILSDLPRKPGSETIEVRESRQDRILIHMLAVLVALLAIVIRVALDPIFDNVHSYSLCLLGVTLVSWYGGFRPGIVCTLISGLLATYLFVEPRYTFALKDTNQVLGFGLFLVCSVGVAVLGEAQRTTRNRLNQKIVELIAATDTIGSEARKSDEVLSILDAFVRNAPYGIAYFDSELRYIRVNETFAKVNGKPVEDHIGRPLPEVLAEFPEALLADYRRVLVTGETLTNKVVFGRGLIWEVTAFAVPMGHGQRGLGVIGIDVTERHQSQEQLRESETRFRQLADVMPQIVFAAQPDGTVDYFNSRWYEYTGFPDDAPITEAMWRTAFDPESYPVTMEHWRRALQTGEAYETQYPLRRSDGVWRWHLGRALPVRDAAGIIVRWFGTNTDIDDAIRTAEALRVAASQQLQLTEGMPMLMWACEPNGACSYLSRQWIDFTGVPLEVQLGDGWLAVLHPQDHAAMAAAWRDAVAEVYGYDVEYRIRRHDGAYRWFAVRGIALRDEAGRITRWYGSCTDIDDRMRQSETLEQLVEERTAELNRRNDELQQQKIFLDAILNNVAEGIVACDEAGTLKLFNKATRRMHGLPVEQLPADRWPEFYRLFESDGSHMPVEHIPLLRALKGEAVSDAELVIRGEGIKDRYVLCSGQRLQTEDGRHFGAVVSMRDMTERREYEQQLLLTTAALKVSNEELEKFAYIASHDLQEPLRKIQAFGTRLADKSRDQLGDQGKDYLDRMLDSAGRMRKLIEDLLSFSRVSTKTIPFASVDLNAVVRDVLSDLEVRIQSTGGTVEVHELPSVPGDAGQQRQVFQNLIGNALKFTKVGVKPLVIVSATRFETLGLDIDPPLPEGKSGWRITVADNGIGFEKDYEEQIFELFQRLHSRSEYEGTGLGLAIVRKIVVRHAATITARSQKGGGAVFVIDWPIKTV